MTVRSLDLQVLIPKAPEVQKAKQMEQAIPQNNEYINMNKEKKVAEEKLSQVNRKAKPEEIRISDRREHEREREEQKKERDNRREKLLEERKKSNAEAREKANSGNKKGKKQENKIDIRI